MGKLTLEIGAVAETVTVTAQSATVQIASGEHADLLSGDQIEGLMTKARNVTSLLSLMPGAEAYNAFNHAPFSAMDTTTPPEGRSMPGSLPSPQPAARVLCNLRCDSIFRI